MGYQPLLFAQISSRYHAFISEVLKDSHCETAQFWTRYMDIIQMVLTLIRATRKTTLNCMPALSWNLVPNVHCTRSHQLHTICTCVTDTHRRCKELLEQNGFSVSQSLVLCLRNAFDNYQANNKPCAKEVSYASAARTTLRTSDGMMYYSTHQSSIC